MIQKVCFNSSDDLIAVLSIDVGSKTIYIELPDSTRSLTAKNHETWLEYFRVYLCHEYYGWEYIGDL